MGSTGHRPLHNVQLDYFRAGAVLHERCLDGALLACHEWRERGVHVCDVDGEFLGGR